MSPTIDFSGVKDLPLVPAGTYPFRFAEFELKDGDKGGYYTCKLVLSGDSEDVDGRSQYTNVSISEKSLWAFKRFCVALGTDPEEFDGPVDTDEMLEGLIGAEGQAKIVQKKMPNEDRLVNNVVAITAKNSGSSFGR